MLGLDETQRLVMAGHSASKDARKRAGVHACPIDRDRRDKPGGDTGAC
jgi:hypothetical protein